MDILANPLSKRKKATSASSINSDISTEDPASATIDVVAVEVPELTSEEQSDRLLLERKVERAFFESGKALSELRDRRLYRSTHRTFEQYCKDRFGLSRDTAYLKLSATVVYDNIEKFLPTNGRQIPMPTNERQLRDLAKADFEPHVQADVWQRAVEQANGKVPSGRIVKSIVEQLKEEFRIQNSGVRINQWGIQTQH